MVTSISRFVHVQADVVFLVHSGFPQPLFLGDNLLFARPTIYPEQRINEIINRNSNFHEIKKIYAFVVMFWCLLVRIGISCMLHGFKPWMYRCVRVCRCASV